VKPTSITHLHLLAVINSELPLAPSENAVRILDIGCGNGRLLEYFAHELARLHASVPIELHGIDVHDHGVQAQGFFDRAVEHLTSVCPDHPWKERLHLIADGDAWPFPDGYFHFAVSNQVLEHVRDHAAFLRELRRTLSEGGVSAHLFPLRHYIFEGHLHLPLVHRFRNTDLLRAYIRACSRLGLGKYPAHRREFGTTLDEFVERHADYMQYFTNYLSQTEILRLAKHERFRASFRYSHGFYTNKLRAVLGLPSKLQYRRVRPVTFDWLSTFLLRYVSSVTLFLTKDETYTRRA
jgi:SAM-dependent methyltransferase